MATVPLQSSDTPEENAAFAKSNNLQFPLLSDQGSILRKVRTPGLSEHVCVSA